MVKLLHTACPKIYRKSVLHLIKYTANLYLRRCNTDLRFIFGHSVLYTRDEDTTFFPLDPDPTQLKKNLDPTFDLTNHHFKLDSGLYFVQDEYNS